MVLRNSCISLTNFINYFMTVHRLFCKKLFTNKKLFSFCLDKLLECKDIIHVTKQIISVQILIHKIILATLANMFLIYHNNHSHY